MRKILTFVKTSRWFATKGMLLLGVILLSCLVASWLFYGIAGHHLIETSYSNPSAITDIVMSGRSVTPVEDYLAAADELVLSLTIKSLFLFLAAGFLIAFIRQPVNTGLVCLSSCLASFGLFIFFEVFPSLSLRAGLGGFAYYSNRLFKIPDGTLGYRYKPGLQLHLPNDRTDLYSPVYGVEVPMKTIEWTINKDGFRDKSQEDPADVVIIGDSFVEYGDRDNQTFGKLLEQRLRGSTVRSLGISGYGPFQYLELLKRYGVRENPQVALFCFYEGNDIAGIREYINWKQHGSGLAGYVVTSKNILWRYVSVLGGISSDLLQKGRTIAEVILRRTTNAQYVHPKIAVLDLGGKRVDMLFVDTERSGVDVEQTLREDEWQQLRKILVEFKTITTDRKIRLIILNIPRSATIYAQYSTAKSGKDWRASMAAEIARAKNTESALLSLAKELNIEVINLREVYEPAAKEGRVVYEQIDTHWNLEGRELAAESVATRLTSTLHLGRVSASQ
jgi:hypothetical protein